MQQGETMGFWDALSIIGSILLIVGVLVLAYYVTRWYAKRMGGGARIGGAAGKYLRVVDSVQVGNASSLAIVEAAGKYYLVALSEKNVQLLRELEDFQRHLDENPMPSTARIPFGQLLGGLMKKGRPAVEKDDEGEG